MKRPSPPTNPDERLRRRETLVPALAVTAVAVVAVATAVMVKRAETSSPQQAILEPASQSQLQAAAGRSASSTQGDVVTAPPLKRPSTDALGGPAACKQCGVVQMVVAVYDHAKPTPRGYQMHIRMDDGSMRTVEQRGALAAGSRVVVEGSTVRPLAQPG